MNSFGVVSKQKVVKLNEEEVDIPNTYNISLYVIFHHL